MKKHLTIAVTAATIGLAGLGAGVASAATDTSTKTDPMSGLVDKIATKFNLNKTEVQQVFDAQKTEMQAARTAQIDEKLATLVKEGKLTQAQVDAIKTKRAELQKEHEARRTEFENLSDEERKAKMEERRSQAESKRAELEKWATDQGIDKEYLRYVMGGGKGHGGPAGHRGGMDKPADTNQ